MVVPLRVPVLVACVVLAGCVSAGLPGASGTATTATDSCAGDATPARQSLPERPGSITPRTALNVAVAYETATEWNERLSPAVRGVNVSVTESTVVNRTGTGYLVHVQGGWGVRRCRGGRTTHGTGTFGANYFVNDSAVVVLDRPSNRTEDPRDGGTVVERWE